jgi:hypothetical protein
LTSVDHEAQASSIPDAVQLRSFEPTGTHIGTPRRIYTIEPLEDPIPPDLPTPTPAKPAEQLPERVPEPALPDK